jgi:hypothetical protein
MVYDDVRDRVVLFGGMVTWVRQDETWEHDGTLWSLANPTHVPSARAQHTMAYDSTRGAVVVFGGSVGPGQVTGDTWEFDGTDWQEVNTSASPSPREDARMTFDSARGVVVLFGGRNAGDDYSDTWEFDGVDWAPISTTFHPVARYGHGLAYHAGLRRVVLFGGLRSMPNDPIGDLWEYDGLGWQQLPPLLDEPPAMAPSGFVFDPDGQRMLLHAWGAQLWTYRYADLWPGEACFNGVDDDGDGAADCDDPDCDGQTCAGGGTCVAGACQAP